MLKIHISPTSLWDETNEEFINVKETDLCLEHSLLSISKWEAKWKKAFLTTKTKSMIEMEDYIRCMIITPKNDPYVIKALTNKDYNIIKEYIDDSMTASTFMEMKIDSKKGDVPTSDLIYYWMVSYNIPFECQKWHLNRLLTLIKICDVKNQDPNSISKKDVMRSNSELNKMRRKAMNSKG